MAILLEVVSGPKIIITARFGPGPGDRFYRRHLSTTCSQAPSEWVRIMCV